MTRTVLLAALSALVSLAADAQTYPAGARAAPDGYTLLLGSAEAFGR